MIHVVGIDFANTNWNPLWDLLDHADSDGVPHRKCNWIFNECVGEEVNAYIYLDMFPINYDKPYIHLNEQDTSEVILDKVKWLASVYGDDTFVPAPPQKLNCQQDLTTHEVLDEPVLCREEIPAIVEAIEQDLTEQDLNELAITDIEVNIGGKLIELSKSDISTLNKIKKLILFYGYTIEKVIV